MDISVAVYAAVEHLERELKIGGIDRWSISSERIHGRPELVVQAGLMGKSYASVVTGSLVEAARFPLLVEEAKYVVARLNQ